MVCGHWSLPALIRVQPKLRLGLYDLLFVAGKGVGGGVGGGGRGGQRAKEVEWLNWVVPTVVRCDVWVYQQPVLHLPQQSASLPAQLLAFRGLKLRVWPPPHLSKEFCHVFLPFFLLSNFSQHGSRRCWPPVSLHEPPVESEARAAAAVLLVCSLPHPPHPHQLRFEILIDGFQRQEQFRQPLVDFPDLKNLGLKHGQLQVSAKPALSCLCPGSDKEQSEEQVGVKQASMFVCSPPRPVPSTCRIDLLSLKPLRLFPSSSHSGGSAYGE